MDKDLIADKLYQIIDQFNEKKYKCKLKWIIFVLNTQSLQKLTLLK